MATFDNLPPTERDKFTALQIRQGARQVEQQAMEAARKGRLRDAPKTASLAELRAIVQGLIEEIRGD